MITDRTDVRKLRKVALDLEDQARILDDLQTNYALSTMLWGCHSLVREVMRAQVPRKWLTTSERMEVLD